MFVVCVHPKKKTKKTSPSGPMNITLHQRWGHHTVSHTEISFRFQSLVWSSVQAFRSPPSHQRTTQRPPSPGTRGSGVTGTESASTFPCWTLSPTETDALAPSARAPPPARPPAGGSARPPAATPCWWRRRSSTRRRSALGSHRPPGRRRQEVRSAETPHWPLPALLGGAVTQRNCRGTTWREGTRPLSRKLRPAAVSSASRRRPGRRRWSR